MHEFLLDFKRWQLTSPAFKDSFTVLKTKESSCLKLCKSDSKCEKTCMTPRTAVERVMYQKQSQFIQMVYRSCVQNKTE